MEPPSRCSDCIGCQECSFNEQQYSEQETMEVLEKSVTIKEVSKSSTYEEDSKEVSGWKAATNSNRKSIPAGRVEDKADKEPTQSLRKRKGKTRPLASRKKGETKDRKGPTCWNCEEVGHKREKCPKPKTPALKREQVNEQLQLHGGALLGLGWSRERDVFVHQFANNVSPRKRKQPTGEDKTLKDFHKLEGVSVANSFYRPRGMISPLPIILKVTLGRLFSKEQNLDWVDNLVRELRGHVQDVNTNTHSTPRGLEV